MCCAPERLALQCRWYDVSTITAATAPVPCRAASPKRTQLSLLSEALNYDFATKGMDEPFTDEELAGIVGMQSMRDHVVQAGIRNPTVRDFMRITGRGLLNEAWVGGPKEIADRLEEWFTAPACDGFVVGPTHQPGCFEAFVQYVVPELQRRGIYRKDYTGATLRDHLGLARPEIGAWRTTLDAAD